ncbi:MAG: response regulator, partial [Myxococcales bacterium]|nr:response regulator [Myxococcales bacterium]
MADRLRLLLLEDSQNDALLLLRELKRSGFEVEYRRVETAEAMEAALRDGAWDLIVSDYTMPHFDAPAALRIVAASGLDIPFIVVSGTVGEDIAVQTMKSGAHDYFLKGSLTRLGAAIRREIKEWELRRAHRRNIAKIEHLNRVLLGIRNVNQLIVRERVPSTIIRTACADLVETRGFAAVWIVHTTAEGRILDYAESGLGDDFPQLVAQVESGSLPDCCRRAQETGELVLIEGQSGGCNGCQLRRCGEGDTLTIQLTHDGVHQGFMSVM